MEADTNKFCRGFDLKQIEAISRTVGEGTKVLASLSRGRGVGGEGNSYIYSATPEEIDLEKEARAIA